MYYCKWQKTDVFTPPWSAPPSAAPRKQGSSLGAAAEPPVCSHQKRSWARHHSAPPVKDSSSPVLVTMKELKI